MSTQQTNALTSILICPKISFRPKLCDTSPSLRNILNLVISPLFASFQFNFFFLPSTLHLFQRMTFTKIIRVKQTTLTPLPSAYPILLESVKYSLFLLLHNIVISNRAVQKVNTKRFGSLLSVANLCKFSMNAWTICLHSLNNVVYTTQVCLHVIIIDHTFSF